MSASVLMFSGPIGSGKTTIASAVAAVLGWKFTSFGEVVREEARRRGLDPESRETLQRLGCELINQGWKEFCQRVLETAGWRDGEGLVIDGIRHVEALDTLRVLVRPLALFLVYVRLDEYLRETRLLGRNGLSRQGLRRIDQHETEAQVREVLADVADLVIDGALPSNAAVRKTLTWLAEVQTTGSCPSASPASTESL